MKKINSEHFVAAGIFSWMAVSILLMLFGPAPLKIDQFWDPSITFFGIPVESASSRVSAMYSYIASFVIVSAAYAILGKILNHFDKIEW